MKSFGTELLAIQREYESTISVTSLGCPSIGSSLVQVSMGCREAPGFL